MSHSLNSGGASMAVAVAFSTNGSLMIFIVNPSPFFALVGVSLTRGSVLNEIDTIWQVNLDSCLIISGRHNPPHYVGVGDVIRMPLSITKMLRLQP